MNEFTMLIYLSHTQDKLNQKPLSFAKMNRFLIQQNNHLNCKLKCNTCLCDLYFLVYKSYLQTGIAFCFAKKCPRQFRNLSKPIEILMSLCYNCTCTKTKQGDDYKC